MGSLLQPSPAVTGEDRNSSWLPIVFGVVLARQLPQDFVKDGGAQFRGAATSFDRFGETDGFDVRHEDILEEIIELKVERASSYFTLTSVTRNSGYSWFQSAVTCSKVSRNGLLWTGARGATARSTASG